MSTLIWGMLAETAIHTGSGRNLGVVDLPVMREAITDMPVIPGSGLKGAMREQVGNGADCDRIFGSEDNAGLIQVSDARLLLLPVRSLTTASRWVTCPMILERVKRDCLRAGQELKFTVPAGEAIGSSAGEIFLEEREFEITTSPDFDNLITVLQKFILHSDTKNRLKESLLVISDDDFAWFCRYGLHVQARNQLGDKKESKNLWYEESLPADSLMYCLLSLRNEADMQTLRTWWQRPYIRVGGNETVGMGWFAIAEVGA